MGFCGAFGIFRRFESSLKFWCDNRHDGRCRIKSMHRLFLLAALCLLFAGCAHDDLPLDYVIGGIDRPIPENAVYLGRSRWTGKVLYADDRRAVASTAAK